MSDLMVCDNCRGIFSGSRQLEVCEHCNSYFCDMECADFDDFDKGGKCCICRKEVATPYILLHALLRHFKLTEEQAFEIWKNEPEVQD